MDRATFDRERIAVQEELKSAGQDIEIPDPDSPEYLSTFLVLQRTHPRLAARLAEAEQADPAELLDPYTPRSPKVTAKHRWNAFVDKNFMRRGIDRKLVLDRQRVFRTGIYTLGGIVVAGLVWSVVAPKPTPASDQASSQSQTQAVSDNGNKATNSKGKPDTSGAFTAVDGSAADESTPTTQTTSVTPAPNHEENTFATSTPDTPPRPITTASSASDTPPPPAVFNQVPQNDPYTPVTSTAEAAPAPAPTPSYADTAPAPIAVTPAATPIVRTASTPFGDAVAAPEPVQVKTPAPASTVPAPLPLDKAPVEVASPFAAAVPEQAPAPVARGNTSPARASAATSAQAPVSAPFGGEAFGSDSASVPAPAIPDSQAASPVQQEQPARGAAIIYQAQRQPETLPKSSMIYQRPAEQNTRPTSALIYRAQAAQAGASVGSMTSQQASAPLANANSGGSLIYQNQPQPSSAPAGNMQQGTAPAPAAFAQTPDPDAPKFAPTSVIQGKLFSNIRTAAGLAVPVIVVSKDGNWVGVASYNTQLGRVDMRFTSFVLNKNGKTYPVDASAYQAGKNGTISEGVGANIHPIAPTLAVDIARAGMNSLNSYTQALQNSGTTTSNGSLLSTTRQAPELLQVVRGEIGKVFALPEGNVSIRIVADVAAGTDIQVVYGVSGIPTDQQAGMSP